MKKTPISRTSFSKKVYAAVSAIPKGSVRTYQQIAVEVGHPGAYRAVGTLMKKNFDPRIPCHRVVRSNGTPGKYNRGDSKKLRLLLAEGVTHYGY